MYTTNECTVEAVFRFLEVVSFNLTFGWKLAWYLYLHSWFSSWVHWSSTSRTGPLYHSYSGVLWRRYLDHWRIWLPCTWTPLVCTSPLTWAWCTHLPTGTDSFLDWAVLYTCHLPTQVAWNNLVKNCLVPMFAYRLVCYLYVIFIQQTSWTLM